MEDEYTSRLHSVALSESDSDKSYESKQISDDKPIIKKKTCFFEANDCLLCKCLYWCCCSIR